MKGTIAAVALLLLWTSLVFAQAYRVGDPVNDFTLQDAYGESVSLSDYPEQIVFMVFWDSG